jgi:hypothetical protein
MATNVGLGKTFNAVLGIHGGTYDSYTYPYYFWKQDTAIRKETPFVSKANKKGEDQYFESASLSKIVDLICEGPIEGFSDKAGNTIRFFSALRSQNLQYLKSIFLNDTPVLNERDNTFNFRVFDADFREGIARQDPFPNSYKSHGKTIFYNSQLFPANSDVPKTNLPSELAPVSTYSRELGPYAYEGDHFNIQMGTDGKFADVLKAAGVGIELRDAKGTAALIKVFPEQKVALHEKFKKLERHMHPVVHTITDTNVDIVSIVINVQALSKNVVGKRTTKTKPADLSFLIYVNNEGEPSINEPPILEVTPEMAENADGAPGDVFFHVNNKNYNTVRGYNPHELIENDTGGYFIRKISGLATSDYLFETKIHLPPNPKGKKRVIRISRIDPDEEFKGGKDSTMASASLHSIVETVSCKLYYPDSAIIGTTIDSRAFANVPDRKYLLKLLKMKVPSNYLPDTKEYVGNWNGKFKTKDVINTSSLTGNELTGTSLSSYKLREAKTVINSDGSVKVKTGTKKFGSGSIFFPSSDTFGTDAETGKVLLVRDSFSTVSNPTTRGDLSVTPEAPLGTFDGVNFTIEFYVKASAAQVQNVYNLKVASSGVDSSSGVEGVPKVLIASEENSSINWDGNGGIPGLAEMTVISDQLQNDLVTDGVAGTFANLFGGSWRIEVGTKNSSDPDFTDLGKVRFRAFSPVSMGTTSNLVPEFSDLRLQLQADITSTTNIADDAWHHIAVVRNGDNMYMFVDGTREASITIDKRPIFGFKYLSGENATRGEIQIGGTKTPYVSKDNKVYATSFNGHMDEIIVSKKAKYIESFNTKAHPRGGTGVNPDNLRDLIKNDFTTQFYIKGDDRDDNSTDIFDFAEAIVDESFRFDENAEFDSAELQWTDNPAWIFYDLVTNKRYGMGKFGLNAESIDKWNLYEIAKYCDEKVKTGLDPKYKPKKFTVSSNPKHGSSRIQIDGFLNQAEFEKEFPEYSTIALYDLNDEKEPVHRRIKYLRKYSREKTGSGSSALVQTNERYSTSNPNKLRSYRGSDENSAGSAIIELHKLISPEECLRIQPGISELLRSKKQNVNANFFEKNATDTQLILQFMDDPANKNSLITQNFDVRQKINSTSTSGLAATEFYGNFDILEPRFSANLYITTQVDAYKILNDVASIFRGITYFANGKIFAHFDKKRDAILNFTNANVKDGNFSYSGSSRSDRFTTCIVRYVDKYENYKPKIEYVEDPDGIVKYGIIEKDLVAFGCASRSQARRLGRWFLFSAQYETETVEFSGGKECAYLRPGDVFKVIDKTRTQKRFGGRVVDFVSGEQKIKVDLNLSEDYVGESIFITIIQDFEFSDALNRKVDKITITDEGSIKQKTVTDEEISNVRKSQIKEFKIKSITADKSIAPHENRIVELEEIDGSSLDDFGKINIGSIFILNQKGTDVKIQEDTFKVVNVGQINDLEYEVQGVRYIESKYDLSDNKINRKLNINYSKSPLTYSRPAKPIGVPRISITSLNGGLERELTVSWEPMPVTPDKYKIVITLQGQGSGSTSFGKKIVLEKDAKDANSEVVDTSVSVNIGNYSGEVDVAVYSIDSNGNLDLIYY